MKNSNKNDIPPVLLKAIAYQESGWKQFNLDPTTGQPLIDQPFISKDGGVGIMKISPANYPDFDVEKLKSDLEYNLDPESLITNGDYWFNFHIDQQPRGDYYVQGLGFILPPIIAHPPIIIFSPSMDFRQIFV